MRVCRHVCGPHKEWHAMGVGVCVGVVGGGGGDWST